MTQDRNLEPGASAPGGNDVPRDQLEAAISARVASILSGLDRPGCRATRPHPRKAPPLERGKIVSRRSASAVVDDDLPAPGRARPGVGSYADPASFSSNRNKVLIATAVKLIQKRFKASLSTSGEGEARLVARKPSSVGQQGTASQFQSSSTRPTPGDDHG
jgi:hypothetical protein